MAPRVSLCLVARNEEGPLPSCLGSAAELVDETIVVDTGSADRTREVAVAFGARVFEFPWRDDFAAARNESLRHATGAWIFWLDADESLDEENRARLKALLDRLGDEPAAYVMRQRSAPPEAGGSPTLVEQCRLFRNDPAIRWSYRVHEQILPAVNRAGHEVRFTDICIDHAGYTDPALVQQKVQRNLRLLLLEEAEQPDEPFVLFNLAWAYLEAGQPERAAGYARRSLERSAPGDSIVRKLYDILAKAHERLNRPREALAWCRAGRARCPDDADLLFREGTLLRGLGDLAGAEAAWRTLLEVRPGEHFAALDAGLRGYKTRHQLALALRDQGKSREAEAQWQAAAAERPDFLPGWAGLAELYLDEGRWDDFAAAIEHLPVEGPLAARGLVLRGRGHLARREFAEARRLLEEAVVRFPQEVPPRVFLSRVLLEQGTDAAAAERALRELAGRAPGLAEGWRNLALLLRNQGRLADAVAVCRAGREHCPQDPRLLLQQGQFLAEAGDLAAAEPLLLEYLEGRPGGPEAEAARDQLALVYLRQERLREAEAQWRALLAEEPHFAGAWKGLAEIALKRERWGEVAEIAGRLEGTPAGDLEAAVLRARGHLARKEFGQARYLVDTAIEAHADAVWPRLVRSRVLLEVRDEPAAEAALRDVLRLEPGNREARHNLRVLQEKNGREKAQKAQKEGENSCGPASVREAGVPIPRKSLRVAFASYYPFPFRVETPYERPLGGSESALCYLAEALAGAGQEVYVLTAGGETGVSRGVPCLPLTPAALDRLPALDALVVQNFAGQGRALREAVGRKTRLVLWSGHGPEQPGVRALHDPGERGVYDAFALVSTWQRDRYVEAFGLRPERAFVFPNAIGPAFQGLFAEGESIVAAKSRPPVLAYTSTPDRGLDLLLEAFPRIRQAVPGARLEVYSSLRLYGLPEAEDEARFGALYRRCRETEGVDYVGPVPQPELARRLWSAAVLAYPNTVPETFGITVLEALAAGCTVVTTAQGALPETTAGFARLVPVIERARYLDRFVEETVAALQGSEGQEERLRQQVAWVNREGTWPVLAGRWAKWLATGG